MRNSADLIRLAQFVEDEFVALQGFVELLAREEALLISGDTDALLPLATDKAARARAIQRLHDDRALLLGRMRLDNSDASLRRALQTMPQALARRDATLDLAREAHRRNTVNGKLITERMQHNQAALSVLLSAADQPSLYGADGQTRTIGGGRSLGSA